MGCANRAEFVQADLCNLEALASSAYSFALALGDPIGCTSAPARALKEIRRVLASDGVLVATFDNRLAALDFYLSGGDSQGLSQFLRDGKTHWLTKDVAERFEITTYGPSELRRLLETSGFEAIEMIGKSVLPMRHHRHLLESPAARREWAAIEKTLSRDPAAIGRASHLQTACRVRP
jgi:SAM-dependent methyltransferase